MLSEHVRTVSVRGFAGYIGRDFLLDNRGHMDPLVSEKMSEICGVFIDLISNGQYGAQGSWVICRCLVV